MAVSTSKQLTLKNISNLLKIRGEADAVKAFNAAIEYVFYLKVSKKLSRKTRKTIVSYGTWLAALALLVILPELLIFAKESKFVGISGFFTAIFFNQASWILMLIVLANCILLVQSLGDIAAKKRAGWNKVYLAFVINFIYVLIQFGQNIRRPAAAIISLVIISFGLFVLLDIKESYKQLRR